MSTLVGPTYPADDRYKALDQERHIMAAYSDTAKTYSQLSLGALVLSVTFFETVATPATVQTPPVTPAVDARIPAQGLLIAAWMGWLLSSLAGAFYQYLAVRFVEERGERWGILTRSGHPQWFRWLADHPWPIYALMLSAFAAGSLAFVIVAIDHLR